MSYNASEPEATDLGFTLPRGTDLIRNGDDAITTNALVATGALRAAFNRLRAIEDAPPPIADHGDLTGRGDDDHPQYLNNTRGDARYAPLTHSHAWADVTGKPSNFPPSAHVHTPAEVTGLQAALDDKVAADDPRLRDTGWRSVPELINPAHFPNVTYCQLRRIGPTVHVAIRFGWEAGKFSYVSSAIPTGFRPDVSAFATPVSGFTSAPYQIGIFGVNSSGTTSFRMNSEAGSGSNAYFNTSWTTSQAWPSTLPGTPA